MSLFLVFLAIALLGAAGLLGAGPTSKIFRRRRTAKRGRGAFTDGFDEPVASLPPVLLPAAAAPSDIDRLRFAVGLRGYRMDQVDQVLDELRDQIAAKNSEIDRLREALAELHPPSEQRQ
ncbi:MULTISPECIES: DivIVA domain-containing protein [Arthrobacter]|uniref:DivIVA domain-containing protein n=1 Tax=Arthrobacter oryzae TaxID=409290 RepID=A0A3N0BVT8_9MICC|nr:MULTISPECIES: DivIVA domain-containing protein [Arthrobacter]QYF89617.1 DivIVA domain-containing protein [Arthrobacter sp. PAMC25284]RNL53291.1 DivIVA domain-containing protein [Arthrobacter oryzae]